MNSTTEQNNKTKQNKNKKKSRLFDHFLYDFVKITGAVPMLLFLRTRTVYAENKKAAKIHGGALISANHVSFIDPVIIHTAFWQRRVYCIATKELYDTPIKNWFFQKMHCIKVDRENFSMTTFHGVKAGLDNDKLVLIFPEGQVNHQENTVLAFKSGAILMAHRCNKPIIPVYIVKRAKWYERQTVMVGSPVDIRAICGSMPTMAQLNEASELLRQREVELKQIYEEKFIKK